MSVAALILSWASPSKVASSMAHGFFDRFFEGVGSPSVFRSFGCLGGPKPTPEDPGEPPKQGQKRQKHVRKGPRSRHSRPKPPREAPRAPRECPRRRQEAPRWPQRALFRAFLAHRWVPKTATAPRRELKLCSEPAFLQCVQLGVSFFRFCGHEAGYTVKMQVLNTI